MAVFEPVTAVASSLSGTQSRLQTFPEHRGALNEDAAQTRVPLLFKVVSTVGDVSFRRHEVKVHTTEKRRTCHVCGKVFSDSAAVKRHIKVTADAVL